VRGSQKFGPVNTAAIHSGKVKSAGGEAKRGCCGSSEVAIVVPRCSWRRIFCGKRPFFGTKDGEHFRRAKVSWDGGETAPIPKVPVSRGDRKKIQDTASVPKKSVSMKGCTSRPFPLRNVPPLGTSLLPGRERRACCSYLNQGHRLSPLPQGKTTTPNYSLKHARSGSDNLTASTYGTLGRSDPIVIFMGFRGPEALTDNLQDRGDCQGPPKLFKIAQDTALCGLGCGLRIQPFSTIDIQSTPRSSTRITSESPTSTRSAAWLPDIKRRKHRTIGRAGQLLRGPRERRSQ
jgi:hypothetical protein